MWTSAYASMYTHRDHRDTDNITGPSYNCVWLTGWDWSLCRILVLSLFLCWYYNCVTMRVTYSSIWIKSSAIWLYVRHRAFFKMLCRLHMYFCVLIFVGWWSLHMGKIKEKKTLFFFLPKVLFSTYPTQIIVDQSERENNCTGSFRTNFSFFPFV